MDTQYIHTHTYKIYMRQHLVSVKSFCCKISEDTIPKPKQAKEKTFCSAFVGLSLGHKHYFNTVFVFLGINSSALLESFVFLDRRMQHAAHVPLTTRRTKDSVIRRQLVPIRPISQLSAKRGGRVLTFSQNMSLWQVPVKSIKLQVGYKACSSHTKLH